jgi:hypothetical protein
MAERFVLDAAPVADHKAMPVVVLAEPRSAKLLRSAFYWFVTMLLCATGSLVHLLGEKADGPSRAPQFLDDPALLLGAVPPRVSPARPTPAPPREMTASSEHSDASLSNSSHPKAPEPPIPQSHTTATTTTTATATLTTAATTPTSNTETSVLLPTPPAATETSSQQPPTATGSDSHRAQHPHPSDESTAPKKKRMQCSGTLMADGISFSYHCR